MLNSEVVMYSENGGSATFHAARINGYSLGSTALSIYGSPGRDIVTGSSGADTITTGLGNDQVAGSAGSDTIDLGEGDDVAFVELADLSTDVSINGGTGSDTLNFGQIYNVTVTGRSYDASVNVDMSSLGNAVNFENLVGTISGADTLTGNASANVLVGSGGSDTLYGNAGNDSLYGDYAPSDGGGFIYGLRSYDVGSNQGNDLLYGGAGDDVLVGNDGNDTLDGGVGSDTLTGGDGVDTFVIRANDGGSSEATADVITDFQDGTDTIGLADGLSFGALTVVQGEGDYINDVIVKRGAEFLLVIQNQQAENISYFDMASTSTAPESLSGTSDGDILLGGSGDDSFVSGAGTDILLGYGGDDSFTIDGSGSKTIDGGSGTNTVSINYSGVSGLNSFVVTMSSNGAVVLTGSNGDILTLSNIVDTSAGLGDGISVGGKTYDFVDPPSSSNSRGSGSMHDGSLGSTQGVAYNSVNSEVVMYSENGGSATFHAARINGYSLGSTALSIYGSPGRDIVTGSSGSDTITTGLGNDQVAGSAGSDTINLGEGDDVAFVELADLSTDVSINGGTGSDTLNFGQIYNVTVTGRSYDASVNVDMSSLGNAVNFENLVGTISGADTLTGNASANVLVGSGGSDTLYGNAGNDSLYGDYAPSDGGGFIYGLRSYDVGSNQGNDLLYGGAGDDVLVGNDGNDTLDGGVGSDTLTGGDGVDTFVIRANDGGLSEATADVITDFQNGTDTIGLTDGLSFGALTVVQGEGDYVNDVIVKRGTEFLLVIQNQQLADITDLDFQDI